MLSGLFRRRMAAIPASTRRKGRMPFLAGLQARRTRQLVGIRSLATPRAAPTRPSVIVRSLATPQAAPTRPPVGVRSKTTPRAITTRPLVFKRSLATAPATSTRPTVIVHSLATLLAWPTPPWALQLASVSPPPITLSLLASVVRTSATAALSAIFAERQRHRTMPYQY